MGHQLVTETPQSLYPGGDAAKPHHTQGLYLATIVSLGQMQRDDTGCSRQVRNKATATATTSKSCTKWYRLATNNAAASTTSKPY